MPHNADSSSRVPPLRPSSMTTDRHDARVVNPFRDGEPPTGSTVTELDLTYMVQRREQTHAQVARTAEELERLQGQRQELERERRRLEAMEQRQLKFETDHRGLHDGLAYRMEQLRKMDLAASRRAELFAAVRRRYEEMAAEVGKLREQSWDPERYDEELNRALAILEDIQREYNRAWSRVEAVTSEATTSPAVSPTAAQPAHPAAIPPPLPPPPREFMDWLRIGVAVSLPLIVVLVVLFILLQWG